MGRLAITKTLSGFNFSFQPSLDRNRILALAQLDFAPASVSTCWRAAGDTRLLMVPTPKQSVAHHADR